MTEDLIFKTNSIFNSVSFDKDTNRWRFYFEDKVYVTSSGFWRLLKSNRIVCVSFDNGHQFGLPHQFDLVDKIFKIITGNKLTRIKIEKNTGDLTLTISQDIMIQIYTSSSGYETYEFSIDDKRYIGLGSGDLGIVEATENPQVFTTRIL